MIIGIDFDGTCTTHEFPKVGRDINAVPVLLNLVKNGHKLVLFTMRSDIKTPRSNNREITPKGGMYLTDAVNWFVKNKIPLYGIQTNPEQHSWTTSPKAYCNLYIDDAGLGMPLVKNNEFGDRPYVNWEIVDNILLDGKYIQVSSFI